MKIILVLFLFNSLSQTKIMKDTIRCGWAYRSDHYELWLEDGKIKCEHTNQVNSRTGKVLVFKGMKGAKCWESLARIQIDGAECCFLTQSGSYYQSGNKICKK